MYLEIYSELPQQLLTMAETPAMQRLKHVGMHCGCEYTAYPIYRDALAPYSRYTHSLGTAAIVWHFTHDLKQAVAGLLHDIATPAFAHVVDFLNGDHLRQESTESRTRAMIASSPELMALLDKGGLTIDDVDDYHRYPIADNDSPRLSADRLEYTLGNAVNYGFITVEQARSFYRDLTVVPNEEGVPELAFRTRETASAFTEAALDCARVYVADEDRFAMEALAALLRRALDRGVLKRADLMGTEPEVIARLSADPVCGPLWKQFRSFSRLRRAAEQPTDGNWIRIGAKLRWILLAGVGRVSRWNEDLAAKMADFRRTDFSIWLSGEPEI